jgi:hypothetical protein
MFMYVICFLLSCTFQLISLQQNHIGDEGVRHVAEALKVNSTLTTLGYCPCHCSRSNIHYNSIYMHDSESVTIYMITLH